jgi:hypothetical protein
MNVNRTIADGNTQICQLDLLQKVDEENEIQTRLLRLSFETGFKAGEALQTLRLEKFQLESENRMLRMELSQLELIQTSELTAVNENVSAKINLVAAKLKELAEKFDRYQKECKGAVDYSQDTHKFAQLHTTICQMNCDQLNKVNPAYRDVTKKSAAEQECVPSPNSDGIVSQQTSSVIQGLTEQIQKETAAIKRENELKRATNRVLNDHVESKKELHAQHLANVKKEAHKKLELIFSILNTTNKTISWNKLALTNASYWEQTTLGVTYRRVYRDSSQTMLDNKMRKIKEKFEAILLTMQTYLKTSFSQETI